MTDCPALGSTGLRELQLQLELTTSFSTEHRERPHPALTLEPGQSLETEPMSPQLVGPLAEVEATLVLRVGGKAEKQVIRLKTATPPDPASPVVPPTHRAD